MDKEAIPKFTVMALATILLFGAFASAGPRSEMQTLSNNDGIESDQLLPDLTVLDIIFSNPHPFEGEIIDICAEIWNIGIVEAFNVSVHFYDSYGGGSWILIGETWIPIVLPGIPEFACISWMAIPAGNHTIKVQVDPYDIIEEMDEGNNEAYAFIWVEGEQPWLPDLMVFDIIFSNPHPFEGEIIDICAEIWNVGTVEALDVTVHFYDFYEPLPVFIGETWIPIVFPLIPELTCISWIAMPAGNHMIMVQVDPYNIIEEIDEGNNEAYMPIWVEREQPGFPDLRVTREDISFSDDMPGEGDTITICAMIHNIGSADAYDIMVWFEDVYETSETLIGDVLIWMLGSGTSTEVCIDWVAEPLGGHEIVVDVDPFNYIPESDEGNNRASRILCVCCGVPYEIFVEAYTFDNDNDGRYDDAVIIVFNNENHMVECADVYIDSLFFGKTPDSGTLMVYNFAEGWHDVSVYYGSYHAVTTFHSEG